MSGPPTPSSCKISTVTLIAFRLLLITHCATNLADYIDTVEADLSQSYLALC